MSHTPRSVILFALLMIAGRSAAQSNADCPADFRPVEHAMGTTCVPQAAQRIVALGPSAFEFAFLSGATIVGAPDWVTAELTAPFPQLEAQFADIENVGYPPNPEVILELQPDVIIGQYQSDIIEAFDQLSAIAPTIISPEDLQDNWESAAEFWSGVLGSSDLVETLQEEYQLHVDELRDALPPDAEAIEVSLVAAYSPEFTLIFLRDSSLGDILGDVGLSRPAAQAYDSEQALTEYGTPDYTFISSETLPLADGDVIFLFGYPTADADEAAQIELYIEELTEGVLWQSLEGVQNDRDYVVDSTWYRAIYYLVAHRVIDDLFVYLTDSEPVLPHPIERLTDSTE